MDISISTSPARIGMERIPGSMEINTVNARLELKQKQAKVNIETEQARVLIDQYQCFAEEGLKNNIDLLKEQTQYAYNHVMEYIARTAQDGDAMKKIGHKANIMIDAAARNSVTVHEFGLGTVPLSRPEISSEGGTVKFDPEPNGQGIHNGVEGNYIPGKVNFNFTPTRINMEMLSYGSVDIRYTGNKVDTYI